MTLSQLGLGLEETEVRRLTENLTHIVHSAGNVKLNQSLEEARRMQLKAHVTSSI